MAIDPSIVPGAVAPYLDPSVLPPAEQVARLNDINARLMASLDPMLTGAPGSSPLTQAAIEAWKVQTLPILQQQAQLQGLGRSPALQQMMGQSLAVAMPQFIQSDITNRLAAAKMLPETLTNQNAVAGLLQQGRTQGVQAMQGEEQLTQSAAQLAASIANQEAQRQIQASQVAGQLFLGGTEPLLRAAQLQQEQQKIALQAAGTGGELQRSVAQEVLDAGQMERLRLQGLSEAMTTGLFGGSVLPPAMSQSGTSVTKQKGSSK